MPWIEGIGDEVLVIFSILTGICIILAAWFSTGIRDIPFISVIVVQLTRRRVRRGQNNEATSTQNIPPQNDNNQEPVVAGQSQSGAQDSVQSDDTGVAEEVPDVPARVNTSETAAGTVVSDTSGTVVNKDVPDRSVTSTDENVSDRNTTAIDGNVSDRISTAVDENVSDRNTTAVDENVSDRISTAVDENVKVDSGEKSCPEDSDESSDTPCSEEDLRKKRLAFFNETHSKSSGETEELPDRCETRDTSPAATKSDKESPSVENVSGPKSLTQLATNIVSEGFRSPVSEQQSESNIVSENLPNPLNEQKSESNVDSEIKRNPVAEQQSESSNDVPGSPSAPSAQTGSREGNYTTPEPIVDGQIRVRIKFLNDTQKLVTCLPTETIGNFRRTHFSQELSQSKLVRFIFNGQDLRNDTSTLQSYNVIDNSVVHCLITTARNDDNHHHQHGEDDGFDIGIYMFPMFGALLGLVWYMRFMYRQFFNVTSTLTLAGITFLYVAALLSSLRGHHGHEHLD